MFEGAPQTKLKEPFWLQIGSHSPIINTKHPWSHPWLPAVQRELYAQWVTDMYLAGSHTSVFNGVPLRVILAPPGTRVYLAPRRAKNGSNWSERDLNVQMALVTPQKVPLVPCVSEFQSQEVPLFWCHRPVRRGGSLGSVENNLVKLNHKFIN